MDMMQQQLQAFREKFGREPGPEDPIFFDPDADIEHSTGWKLYTAISNFSACGRMTNRWNGGRQAIPRHHSTHSCRTRHVCSLSRLHLARLGISSLKLTWQGN
jgi:hypothetical protein